MRRRPFVLPALAAVLLAAGCGESLWLEYRDDPYVAALAGREAGEAMKGINSPNREERILALRLLAARAGEAGRRGRDEEAAKLEEAVIRRYRVERDLAVRTCIMRLCAPMIGLSGGKTVPFLRGRIATGDFPGQAALALASLAPPGVFGDIESLTRHPEPEIRFQAAEALTVLLDPRGFAVVARVWRSMREPAWPAEIMGVDLAAARAALAARAMRGFGRPLF
ncbi:MAG: hypothetical protein LBU23_05680 [Planctomycetota bacterium]|jgi:hypothetical protein|nr:hypothetical protein [Planctomycetota bacterium]